MKIRTITAGLSLDLVDWKVKLAQTWENLQQARSQYEAAKFEVQTLRIALAPFLHKLEKGQRSQLLPELDKFCRENNLEFLSLGSYKAGQLETREIIELMANYPAFNLSTAIAGDKRIWANGVREAATIITGLATATADGLCNFRYCAAASCPPGIPFFPAAYHDEKQNPTLALGMQMPDIALQAIGSTNGQIENYGLEQISTALTNAIVAGLLPMQQIAQNFCLETNLEYAGIDVSLAPLGTDSVVAGIEAAGLGQFGEAGTLAVAAAITDGLKGVSAQLKTIGYNGLMLPILEDALLGQRAAAGKVDVQKLLMYSSVCGTGLDVVPLPGDVSAQQIARLLFDVAALSARYAKPLSARLFPVPGKQAGDLTEFDSPYLTNTRVMSL